MCLLFCTVSVMVTFVPTTFEIMQMFLLYFKLNFRNLCTKIVLGLHSFLSFIGNNILNKKQNKTTKSSNICNLISSRLISKLIKQDLLINKL